jgi:hypothetical protein
LLAVVVGVDILAVAVEQVVIEHLLPHPYRLALHIPLLLAAGALVENMPQQLLLQTEATLYLAQLLLLAVVLVEQLALQIMVQTVVLVVEQEDLA